MFVLLVQIALGGFASIAGPSILLAINCERRKSGVFVRERGDRAIQKAQAAGIGTW